MLARFLLFAAVLAAAACQREPERADPSAVSNPAAPIDRAALLAEVKRRTGYAIVGAADSGTIPGTRLDWTSYFASPPSERKPGALIWVIIDSSGAIRWFEHYPTDTWPHTLVWRDLSGDSLPDLFALSGQESDFDTRVYLQRSPGRPGRDTALFHLAYRDTIQYAALVDLDADGKPELIDRTGSPVDEESDCGPHVPDSLQAEVQKEYERTGRRFHAANFTYGDLPTFGVATLMVTAPVTIVQFRADSAIDATAGFPQHLQWRLRILEEVRAATSEECRNDLDPILEHVRSGLKRSGN